MTKKLSPHSDLGQISLVQSTLLYQQHRMLEWKNDGCVEVFCTGQNQILLPLIIHEKNITVARFLVLYPDALLHNKENTSHFREYISFQNVHG